MHLYIQQCFQKQMSKDQSHRCQAARSSGNVYAACVQLQSPQLGVSLKEAQTVIPPTFKFLANLDHLPFAIFKFVLDQTNETNQKIKHTKLYLYRYFRNIPVVAFKIALAYSAESLNVFVIPNKHYTLKYST